MRAARILIDSDELKPAARRSLSGFVASIDRWRNQKDSVPHNELAQIVLDESGYTQMWMDDKSPEAPGKLDNLKELIRFMDDFGSLNAYLEHISLIMDAETNDSEEKVSLMTLHAAKGLEFLTIFLPGWEEGLFPHQRSLDETGDRGLEEERRLAYVGITRAKENITISFAGNRRIHGQWQAAIPSRFIDELPEEHVEPLDADIGFNQNQNFQDTSQSQFVEHSSSDTYSSPGWQRMQRNRAAREHNKTINVKVQKTSSAHSSFKIGERVFHQKFGYGKIGEMDGNKLTVHFEKAGTKKVIDSFLQQV
jgi:DNA helicase-2/ATP-dependent DNA helicase PcrA